MKMKVELDNGDWKELEELRVVDLRLLLGKYDLSKTGTKPILLKRLENYLQELKESEKAEAAEETEQEPLVEAVEQKEEEQQQLQEEEEPHEPRPSVIEQVENKEEEVECIPEKSDVVLEMVRPEPGNPPLDDKKSPSRVENMCVEGEESPLILDADVSDFKEEEVDTEAQKDCQEDRSRKVKDQGHDKKNNEHGATSLRSRSSRSQGTHETSDLKTDTNSSPKVGAEDSTHQKKDKEVDQKQDQEESSSPLNGATDHENTKDIIQKSSMTTPLAKPTIPFRKLTKSVSKEERKPRTWSDCKLPEESAEAVSTESIKDIIPDLKPLLETNTSVLDDELVVVVEDTSGMLMEEKTKTETPPTPTATSTTENENKRENDESKDNHEDTQLPSQCDDVSPSKRPRIDPPPSAIDENETDVLFIRNLVRPFTLTQLKELLKRTGNVEDFWINKIKSHCYVRFSKVEEASETRHALDGVKWPNSNPKTLSVTFSTRKKMEETAEEKTSFEAPPLKTEPKEAVRPSKEKEKTNTESKESTKPQLLDDLFRKTKTTPCIYWTVNEKSLKKEDRKKDEVVT